MSQVDHSNARINQHVREIIHRSNLTNVELARHCGLNVKGLDSFMGSLRKILRVLEIPCQPDKILLANCLSP